MKYVFRNPVHAEIVQRVEEYSWSSVANQPGKIKHLVTRVSWGFDQFLPQELDAQLEWYNESYADVRLKHQVALGLQRTELKFKAIQNSKILLDPKMGLPRSMTR
jgi:hypothetical protein